MVQSNFKTANQLLREGKLEDSIVAYREAIALNPGFSYAHQNLGEALEKAGRLEEAIAAFRQVVAINPQAPWSLYKLGVMLSQQGQFQEAVGYLRRALDIKKDVPEFYLGLGSGLVKLGQWSEAEHCLDRVIQFSPDSQSPHPTPYSLLPAPYLTEAYFYLAEAKSGQEQWSEAVEFYRQSWEVNPGRVDCCIGWAKALGKLGRWSKAVEFYRQAVVLSGESGEVLFGLGQALGQLGRWEEAVVEYGRAISLGFAGAEVRHHLGYALGQLGRWEEAVVEYRLVVEINPKSAQVRHQLGYALMRLERWREAEIELRKAVELHPGSAVVWQQLGDVLRELGENEEATSQKLQKLNPTDSGVYGLVSNGLLKRVRKDKTYEPCIGRVMVNPSKFKNKSNTGVTVITPTGDRYAAFSKCLHWVLTQTVLPSQWIIVDDGVTSLTESVTLPDWVTYIRRMRKSEDPPHTLSANLLATIDKVEYDKIFIIEDDDWYASDYIEYILPFLENYDMVGANLITYYHLFGKSWKTGKPEKHTALAQTACTKKALNKLKEVCLSTNWEVREKGIIDRYWWHGFEGKKLLIQDHPRVHVGFKGLFGRKGIAEGHASNSWGYRLDDDFEYLTGIIGKDFGFYKHWGEGAKKPFVIYTSIAGGYDSLKEPLADSPLFDFYVFSDEEVKSEKWRWIPFDEVERNANITAKKPKILPHLYFPHYEWSIFIDANIFILDDLVKFLEKAIENGQPIAQFLHPERESIFEEAKFCAERNRDNEDIMNCQTGRYQAEGFKDQVPLRECNFMVRKHNDPKVVKMSAIWWDEVCKGSQRDQISYPYALWKAGLAPSLLDKQGKSVRNVPELYYVGHGCKTIQDYIKRINYHKSQYGLCINKGG